MSDYKIVCIEVIHLGSNVEISLLIPKHRITLLVVSGLLSRLSYGKCSMGIDIFTSV